MRAIVVIVALLSSVSASAAEIGGRVKLDAIGYEAGADTLEDSLGYSNTSELSGQLRLELTQNYAPWKFQAAWQLDARHGTAVKRDHAIAANYPALVITGTETNYWDLEESLTDSGANQVLQRFDRLNIGYSRGALVARLGRQALTWGSGLVFHPMDLVNPFQPVATDTVYKRGSDMAYAQYLFEDGSDIQFAAVPRRDDGSAASASDKNTYSAFANIAGDTVQWSTLLARDRAAKVFGLGASGTLGGAVWNMEVVPTSTEHHVTETSALANMSYAPTLLQRNATLFIELYHNGFGEKGRDYTVSELNPDLLARLSRGQVFVTGRDYLSLGGTWEWTPLLKLSPTLIFNVHDRSALFDLQLNRSLSDNASFKAGLRFPSGAKGTEFGGLEVAPATNLYVAEPAQAFVRLEYYY